MRSLRSILRLCFIRFLSFFESSADRLSRVISAFVCRSLPFSIVPAVSSKRSAENFFEYAFESRRIVFFTSGWRIIEIVFTMNEFIERISFLFIGIRSVGFFKQAFGEGVGVEGLQVVEALAHADEFDRELELVFDGQHHAAAGGAVELGQDDTGQLRRLHELPRLIDRVLPGGGVQHQQHLPVRVGQLLVHHAVDLGELVHQVLFIVQPPGGVADDDIHVPGDTGLQRVVDDRGGVRAFFVLDDIHARPVGPDDELVDRRRAEGVRRAEQHLLALRLVHGRHFADRGRLARAVDADHQDHGGDRHEPHVLAAVEQLGDDVLQLFLDLARLFDLFAPDALLELLHHLHGGVDAHVAHDEDLLQLRIEVVLKGIEGIEHVVDRAGHLVPGLRQAEVDLAEYSHKCKLLLL